jgi:hypothetical protein
MDDENSLESILPKEVLDKIASAVQGRTVLLSGAAIGKATNTGTLTVGAAATVGAIGAFRCFIFSTLSFIHSLDIEQKTVFQNSIL